MIFNDATSDEEPLPQQVIQKCMPTKHLLIIILFTAFLIGSTIFVNLAIWKWRAHLYEFKFTEETLVMKDGVSLSVTLAIPVQRRVHEKFSVLLDYSIYRKDDVRYIKDYKYYAAFASSGYAVARVDVRGTGSSDGKIGERMLSEQELEDGLEVIHQLASKSWSTGKVALFGIAYNAFMLAARRPPALKTMFVLHGSDDLFYRGMHYIDGVLHKDQKFLSLMHQSALPKSPKYSLDDNYFTNRFDQDPWIFKYLEQQTDGTFWRKNSLMYNYTDINIPVYLVAGLYEGHRDSALRIYDALKNKVPKMKVVLGPFNHDWPSYAIPGPHYDGKEEAVKWFNYWLKGSSDEFKNEPDVTIFLRDSYAPRDVDGNVPGSWRYDEWSNAAATNWQKLHFMPNNTLSSSLNNEYSFANNSLNYDPTAGSEAGHWWGDMTPDMKPFDDSSLVYDSEILKSAVEIVGFPSVSLRVSADAPLAHWNVRLEEVYPDGASSLVTGGLLNGAHRNGRDKPQYLEPNTFYTIKFDLHVTTWRFIAGNRIRISISNALWPMTWPTPYKMTTILMLNDKDSWINLPTRNPTSTTIKEPAFTKIAPYEFYAFTTQSLRRSDAYDYDFGKSPRNYVKCNSNPSGAKTVVWTSDTYSNIRKNFHASFMSQIFKSDANNPAKSSWTAHVRSLYIFNFGEPEDLNSAPNPLSAACGLNNYNPSWMPEVSLDGKRTVDLRTDVLLESDKDNFYVSVTRTILENSSLKKNVTFTRVISRQFQ